MTVLELIVLIRAANETVRLGLETLEECRLAGRNPSPEEIQAIGGANEAAHTDLQKAIAAARNLR